MSITLLVRISGKPGHGPELTRLLRPLPADNDIEGCSGWDVFVNANSPDEILLVERWSSVDAHQKFITAAAAAGGLNEVMQHAQTIERTYFVETQ